MDSSPCTPPRFSNFWWGKMLPLKYVSIPKQQKEKVPTISPPQSLFLKSCFLWKWGVCRLQIWDFWRFSKPIDDGHWILISKFFTYVKDESWRKISWSCQKFWLGLDNALKGKMDSTHPRFLAPPPPTNTFAFVSNRKLHWSQIAKWTQPAPALPPTNTLQNFKPSWNRPLFIAQTRFSKSALFVTICDQGGQFRITYEVGFPPTKLLLKRDSGLSLCKSCRVFFADI